MDCTLIDSINSVADVRSRSIGKTKQQQQQLLYMINGNNNNLSSSNSMMMNNLTNNNNNNNSSINSIVNNSNGKRDSSEFYDSNENNNNDKRIKRTKIADLNENIICRLCKGYLIDATTLVDCVHSFCRPCILKYIQDGKTNCPTCKSQHRIKQDIDLKMDKNLQNIVYSLVPRLYENEMARRRAFYARHPEDAIKVTPEQRGEGPPRPEDRVSLVIEYMNKQASDQIHNKLISDESKSMTGESVASTSGYVLANNGSKRRKCTESATSTPPPASASPSTVSNNNSNINNGDNMNHNKLGKRYLLCTAGMPVVLLKKFILKKYYLKGDQYDVEIAYKDTILDDKWTLIDVSSYHGHKELIPLLYRIVINSPPTKLQSSSPVTGKMDNNSNSNDSKKLATISTATKTVNQPQSTPKHNHGASSKVTLKVSNTQSVTSSSSSTASITISTQATSSSTQSKVNSVTSSSLSRSSINSQMTNKASNNNSKTSVSSTSSSSSSPATSTTVSVLPKTASSASSKQQTLTSTKCVPITASTVSTSTSTKSLTSKSISTSTINNSKPVSNSNNNNSSVTNNKNNNSASNKPIAAKIHQEQSSITSSSSTSMSISPLTAPSSASALAKFAGNLVNCSPVSIQNSTGYNIAKLMENQRSKLGLKNGLTSNCIPSIKDGDKIDSVKKEVTITSTPKSVSQQSNTKNNNNNNSNNNNNNNANNNNQTLVSSSKVPLKVSNASVIPSISTTSITISTQATSSNQPKNNSVTSTSVSGNTLASSKNNTNSKTSVSSSTNTTVSVLSSSTSSSLSSSSSPSSSLNKQTLTSTNCVPLMAASVSTSTTVSSSAKPMANKSISTSINSQTVSNANGKSIAAKISHSEQSNSNTSSSSPSSTSMSISSLTAPSSASALAKFAANLVNCSPVSMPKANNTNNNNNNNNSNNNNNNNNIYSMNKIIDDHWPKISPKNGITSNCVSSNSSSASSSSTSPTSKTSNDSAAKYTTTCTPVVSEKTHSNSLTPPSTSNASNSNLPLDLSRR